MMNDSPSANFLIDYDKRSRQLIELINSIRDSGGHFDMPIPGIAVVGNQSAGKSSLIESIVRVPLPRSDGTCTRCPMECRLVDDENIKWLCEVTLRMEVDKSGNRLEKPIELKFGESMSNVEEVENRLRRAQKAVLNPTISDFKMILDATDLDAIENEISFTDNVVCLLITGKGVGNLTLIDLPGIISSTENAEDSKYIDLVKNLSSKSIKPENIIIVECITCKDDIDNQSVHTLAKERDKEGIRTIGVLTKPDTIEQGCHDQWLKMMLGESHRLYHGYYMVKNPTKKDLKANISFEHARSKEMNFFKSNSPWNEHPEIFGRLGVTNLKKCLSERLVEMMDKCLPDIVSKTASYLVEIESDLQELPQPVVHKRLQLIQCINNFSADVIKSLNEDRENFLMVEKEVFEDLRIKIKRTVPLLIHNNAVCALNRSGESDDEADEAVNGDITSKLKMTIKDIKNEISRNKGRDFAGLFQNEVVKRLIQKALQHWRQPTFNCLKKSMKL